MFRPLNCQVIVAEVNSVRIERQGNSTEEPGVTQRFVQDES